MQVAGASRRASGLSARGLRRVRCVARTVADLEGREGPVEDRHVLEAVALRGAPVGPSTTGSW
ncbi:hypothetical protein [Pseudomonas sp.]|uniref:magnesium chelatase subunit ChlI family protein n=1 Tax=Pseudomonas sp. TaxID=306 RepID=UPI00338E6F51